MKEYDVKITETLEKTVTVQAENRDAAEEQVKTAYYNSEHQIQPFGNNANTQSTACMRFSCIWQNWHICVVRKIGKRC